jgi:transcriptional regulator with XRE-family HTH domain
MPTFAEKLRELREAKGWTQTELAERSGTAQQSVANWENGTRVPALDSAQALCRALGVACTVFDGCEYVPVESRGRGRPKKAAPADVKQAKAKRKGKP